MGVNQVGNMGDGRRSDSADLQGYRGRKLSHKRSTKAGHLKYILKVAEKTAETP